MTQIFSNYLLIVDAYYNIPKLYGMEKITTEEVMDNMDMFQSRFGEIDEFGWWYLEKVVSLVKLLGAVDGTISIKNHLKGAFGLSGILDLVFLFIEEI